ncbi:APC family permease [Actinoplanes sp. NPDC051343]|uniref:APC family permease n=1 Tax=Actinoplanes sp. NPDC051343 TaxID=3363906 RepID=UPI003795CD84
MTRPIPQQRPPGRTASRVSQALAADRLGVWTVVAIVGGAIAPMTVVAGGATTGWAVSHVIAIPLAYLVVAVLLMVFSGGYTAMIGRGSVSAGPLYTVAARGLGRPIGVAAGLVALVAYIQMQAGLFGGFGAVGAPLLQQQFGWNAPWWAWSCAAWAIVGLLAVLFIDRVGQVLAVLLFAEVVVTLVYTAVMFAHPAGRRVDLTAVSPGQLVVAGFGAACAIAIAGYVGFEGTGNLSEESKNPRRTVPTATIVAIGVAFLLYGGAALAMVVTAGPGKIVEAATNGGSDTMFNLAAPYVPDWLIVVGRFLFLSSLFASALAFHSVIARYLFTLGREGVLFRSLARTSARSNAPIAASITQTVIGLLIIGLYVVNGWKPLTQMFYQLTIVGGLGVLILMIIASAATTVFFARRQNRAGISVVRGVIAPALSTLALAWVLVETFQQFTILIGVDAGSPLRWFFPGLFGVAFVVGIGWALNLRRRPDVYAAIGTSKPPQPVTAQPAPAVAPAGW